MRPRRPAAGPSAGLVRLVIALGLSAACGGGSGEASPTADGGTSSGGAEPDEGEANGSTGGTLELRPSAPTTTTPEGRALAALLLAEVPLAGFQRADDALGAGALDLDAAAAAEADVAGERSLLEEEGFVRGASRAWVDPAQDVVYLAVYEFEGPRGATAYLEESVARLEATGARSFDVPAVEGARGFTTVEESPEGTFTAHAVTFTRGERWVLALVGSPGSVRSADEARTVAAAQAALLG